MRVAPQIVVARVVACVGLVLAVVLFYRRIAAVNPTTVALTCLVIVLAVSAVWRLRYAVFTAVVATVCFNFFFLPPFGTFTIADPQNWIALFAFLATAVIASQLAERAHRNADTANQRRREAERLYAFSQRLLLTEKLAELMNAIPAILIDIFGGKASAIFVRERQQTYRSNPDLGSLHREDLVTVSLRGQPINDPAGGVCIAPVRIGVNPVGSVGLSGATVSLETLEAVGSLIAIAIERVESAEKLSKAEASRESERLRSVLLDSVAHEFRTPLMAIKASVTGLQTEPNLDEAARSELLSVINEETDRLNRLVGEATEMAALDASQVELHLESTTINDVIAAALEETKNLLKDHRVEVHAAANLPAIRLDAARIKEVLIQLLENAAKYSPEVSPISITAEVKNRQVVTSVADRGQGIEEFEQAMIFEKFYRGQQQRERSQGTGMGLSIAKAIVEAHGGSIGVTSQLGHGSVFQFSLPVN
jgi:two-component system, OmpR family, sensor histidine kinase KdpD